MLSGDAAAPAWQFEEAARHGLGTSSGCLATERSAWGEEVAGGTIAMTALAPASPSSIRA